NQTLIEHYNGTNWTVISSPNQGTNGSELQAISAFASNDVWAAGFYYDSSLVSHTLIEHWDGTTWTVSTSTNQGSNANELYGISARASNDVWAAGYYDNGTHYQTLIEHWNGTTWTTATSANSGTNDNYLEAIYAYGASDVWAVGSYYNGTGSSFTLTEHWD